MGRKTKKWGENANGKNVGFGAYLGAAAARSSSSLGSHAVGSQFFPFFLSNLIGSSIFRFFFFLVFQTKHAYFDVLRRMQS